MNSKYFTIKELSCRCGCGLYNITDDFLGRIEFFREELGRPIINPCGTRCETHNAEVGGHPNSYHLIGEALDIPCEDDVFRGHIIELAIQHGFNGIGIKGDCVHIDNRDSQLTIWTY